MPALPDNVTEVGNIHISVVLAEDGPHTAFSFDGVSPEAAIGHLTVVIDRFRAMAADGWGDDFECDCDCPNCHDPEDDDDGQFS